MAESVQPSRVLPGAACWSEQQRLGLALPERVQGLSVAVRLALESAQASLRLAQQVQQVVAVQWGLVVRLGSVSVGWLARLPSRQLASASRHGRDTASS